MNPGDAVSHYRLVSPLGGGGVGVVWLSEDLALGRKVALKFLPAGFAAETVCVERFYREARRFRWRASADHPRRLFSECDVRRPNDRVQGRGRDLEG
jgi:serine/threonine protein kinase